MNLWKTSVTELVQNFREALLSLVPFLEKSKIKWRGETYDDWDTIVEALYKAMVISPIAYAQVLDYEHCNQLAKYEFHYNDFSNNSFILVKNSFTNKLNSFYGFETNESIFDQINLAIMDEKTLLFIEYLTIPYFECQFFVALNKDGKIQIFDELNVLQ